MECQEINGFPNFESVQATIVPDNGAMHISCNKGHTTLHVLTQPKHELLSELSICAIKDGYYREGVVSFASALESLYRFYVKVILLTNGVDSKEFEKSWSAINLSERQFGAFSIAYLIETGVAYKNLPADQVKFRNKVVHNGQIPSLDEAIQYCQSAATCALPIIKQLESDKYIKTKTDIISSISASARNKAESIGMRISAGGILTPLSLRPGQSEINIANYLEEHKNWNVENVVAEIATHATALNSLLTPETRD
ncbi:MAG: hypothetical protein LDL37_09485 [Asticcacaulis sp.]|nr:hypothetical protein [Asticcacaulis sp.]